MKNFSRIPLGTDITKTAGYVYSTTDRLGAVSFQFENVGAAPVNSTLGLSVTSQGPATATITVKYFTASSTNADGSTSGTWTELVAPFTLAAGCRKNVDVVCFSRRVGIFGSGSTVVTLEIPHPHAAALRGGSIDIEPVGRQGFGFDNALPSTHSFPAIA